jgi:ABC-type amino acid transport substrate-binding protein
MPNHPPGTAVLALASAMLSGPATADFAEIKTRGTLRVIANAGEQAEMFAFDGARPGFERELLEGFARQHKLRLEVVRMTDRDQRLPALRRGEGDVVIGIVVTPEREALAAFTAQVLPAPHVAVNLAPRPPIASPAALREQRVAVLQGASWTDDLAAAGVPPSRTVSYPDRAAALRALQAGDATATVMSFFNYAILAREMPGLQAGARIGPDDRAAWAVRKEDAELRQALDAHLRMAQASLTWSRLVVKYFGERALEVLGRR